MRFQADLHLPQEKQTQEQHSALQPRTHAECHHSYLCDDKGSSLSLDRLLWDKRPGSRTEAPPQILPRLANVQRFINLKNIANIGNILLEGVQKLNSNSVSTEVQILNCGLFT